MLRFSETTPTDLSAIFGGTAADIEIPADVTKFNEQLPDVDFSNPLEVAPSPATLTAEAIAHAVVYGGTGLEGKYLRFVLSVYAKGGKIYYTELKSGNYKAEVRWPSRSP